MVGQRGEAGLPLKHAEWWGYSEAVGVLKLGSACTISVGHSLPREGSEGMAC